MTIFYPKMQFNTVIKQTDLPKLSPEIHEYFKQAYLASLHPGADRRQAKKMA